MGAHSVARNISASTSDTERGRRRKRRRIEPYSWLGVGAVTLGIGAAALAGSGVASADEGPEAGGSSTSAAPSANDDDEAADSGSAETRPPDESDRDVESDDHEGSEESAEPEDGDGSEVDLGGEADPSPSRASTRKRNDDRDTVQTPDSPRTVSASSDEPDLEATRDAHEPVVDPMADRVPAAVTPVVDRSVSTGTEQLDVTEASSDASLTKAALAVPAEGLSALASVLGGPAGPVESPLAWLVLAAARRHAGRTAEDLDFSEVLSANAIGAAEVNTSPTATLSRQGSPSSWTGKVTGTIKASDVDGDRLTYTATTTAKGKVTVSSRGTFTYTPTAAARHAAAAVTAAAADKSDTFTITVTDGKGGFAEVPVTVAIRPANSAPSRLRSSVAKPDPVTGVVTGRVSASDGDGDGFTYAATTNPKSGAVTVNADGTFSYTATPAARTQARSTWYSDTDSFKVTVDDGHGGVKTITVRATIAPANTAPITGVPTFGVPNTSNGAVKGSVNAVDPDGDKLTYSGSATTAKGKLTITSTGAFTYTPTAAARHAAATGAQGDSTDVVSVLVKDKFGAVSSVPVTITILPKNAAPTNVKATAGQPDSATGAVSIVVSATDADGDTLTYTALSSTPKGTVTTLGGGSFTYVPTPAARHQAAHTPGADTDTVTVTVDDGHGGATSVSVNVTVAPLAASNAAPIVGDPGSTVDSVDTATGVVRGHANVSDPDNDTVTYALSEAIDPALGIAAVDTQSGMWTFTPTADARAAAYFGADSVSFSITATDGDLDVSVAVVAPISPVAPSPLVTVTSVDHATGAVTGVVAVAAGGVAVVYSLQTPIEPALGVVEVDAESGQWVFRPTAAARMEVSTGVRPPETTFVVVATHGLVSVPATVTAPVVAATSSPGTVKRDPLTGDIAVKVESSGLTHWIGFNPITGSYELADSDVGDWTATWIPGSPTEGLSSGRPYYGTGAVKLDPGTGSIAVRSDPLAGKGDWFVITSAGGGSYVPAATVASWLDVYTPASSGDYAVDGVNTTTGKVSGHINAPAGTEYVLAADVDPAVGTVTLDPDSGQWTYTPTTQAVLKVWASKQDSTATFTITAVSGSLVRTVEVTVPIGFGTDTLVGHLQRHGSQPTAVAISATYGLVYVLNSGANTVTALRADDLSKVATFNVGRNPTAIVVTDDGTGWVVNTDDGTVSLLSGTTNYRTINVGVAPTGIAADPNGYVYVANSGDGTVSVINVSGRYVERTVAVGGTPHAVAVDADGRAYVTDSGADRVLVIDPAADYAVSTIDDVGGSPYAVAVGADGTIYVSNPFHDTVTVLRPSEDGDFVRESLSVGDSPSEIRVSDDGRVIVANTGADTVTVIDQDSLELSVIAVGANPLGFDIGADGAVIVANAGGDSVSVIGINHLVTNIDVGQDVSRVSLGPSGELIVVNNFTGETNVIPVRPGALPNYDVHTVAGFGSVSGFALTVSTNGTLYVGTSGWFNTSITAYTPAGGYLGYVSYSNFLGSPGPMLAMHDGRLLTITSNALYVANWDTRGIDLVYSPDLADSGDFLSGAMAVGHDDRIYLLHRDNSVTVLNADFSVLTSIDLGIDPDPWVTSGGTMTVGDDGRVYVISSNTVGQLAIIDPAHLSVERVTFPGGVRDVEVGHDGRVYLLNSDNGTRMTVLNPQHAVATTLSLGVDVGDMVMGPDGRIFFQLWSGSIGVLDPADYSLSSLSIGPSGAAYLATGTDAAYAIVVSGYSSGGATLTNLVSIAPHQPDVPPEPDPDPPTEPDPGTPVSYGQAPSTVAALYERLRKRTTAFNDGIYIETVQDAWGDKRLIVYVGGTDPGWGNWTNQAIWENFSAGIGIVKSDQVALIDQALEDCGSCDDIMLVGYSQGGLDALNLANDWRYRDKVSTVITYGTPIMRSAGPGDAVIHIQDDFDPIAHLPDILLRAVPGPFGFVSSLLYRVVVTNSGEMYQGSSGIVWDAHGDVDTYLRLGQKFESNTDAKYLRVKNNINNFEGNVIDYTLWTEDDPIRGEF